MGRTNIPKLLSLSAILFFSFLFCGCGNNHDTSTLKAAMLGHWEAKSGNLDYYIQPGTIVRVDEEGSTTFIDYSVVKYNEGENWMVLKTWQREGRPGQRGFRFTEDRKSFEEGITILGEMLSNGYWVYAGADQKPTH